MTVYGEKRCVQLCCDVNCNIYLTMIYKRVSIEFDYRCAGDATGENEVRLSDCGMQLCCTLVSVHVVHKVAIIFDDNI